MAHPTDIAAAAHDVVRARDAVTLAEAKLAERLAALADAERRLADLQAD